MAGTCAPGSRSAGSMHAVLPRVALSTADARREFSLNSTTPGPVRLGLVGRILLASCRDLARKYQEWASREDARDEQWRDLS